MRSLLTANTLAVYSSACNYQGLSSKYLNPLTETWASVKKRKENEKKQTLAEVFEKDIKESISIHVIDISYLPKFTSPWLLLCHMYKN